MASSELHRGRTNVSSCKYQVVFCPKDRRKVLVPPIDGRLKELILEKQTEYSDGVIEMEVMPDHVHLHLDVDPRIGIDADVRKIKGYTAHTIRKEDPWMKSRLPSLWTRSRFIASVGAVSLEVVKQYIEEQKGK
jgi:putative transposase